MTAKARVRIVVSAKAQAVEIYDHGNI